MSGFLDCWQGAILAVVQAQQIKNRRIVRQAATTVGAISAALAPVSLTGIDSLDVIYRGAIAAAVIHVGCHARRLPWLAAGFMVGVVSSGVSLGLALGALGVFIASAFPKRRPRHTGAVGVALMVNAAFWLPASTHPLAPYLAFCAFATVMASGFRWMPRSQRQVTKWTAVSLGVFLVVAAVGAGAAMALAAVAVKSGAASAESALDYARDGNGDSATTALNDSAEHFSRAQDLVDGWLSLGARAVPGVAQQRDAVSTVIQSGLDVTAAGSDLAQSADYDKLRFEGALDLTHVSELQGPAARATSALGQADAKIQDVLNARLAPPLRSRVLQLSEEITEARKESAMASELLNVVPGLFGGEGERRYLVVFLASAEIRGSGGMIGSYAELWASHGEVELTRSGNIRDLIEAAEPGTRTITGPQDFLERYGRFKPQDFLQDITLSPDLPTVAKVLAELYPQSGGAPIDGVIAADPRGLAALLELTGPVEVNGLGYPLKASNAVNFLTKDLYTEFPTDAAQDPIQAEAIKATFEALVSASLPSPRALSQSLSPAARGGHLRAWSQRNKEQEVFRSLGADGEIRVEPGSDALAVVQQNAGNNKLDAYLKRDMTYEVKVNPKTGQLAATLKIFARNEIPTLDLPDAVVANQRGAPRGTNVSWFTILTPHDVKGATIDGRELKMARSTERGLHAWDSPFVRIPPGGEVTIEIELRGAVTPGEGYRLRLMPQPRPFGDTFKVSHSATSGGTPKQLVVDQQGATSTTEVSIGPDNS